MSDFQIFDPKAGTFQDITNKVEHRKSKTSVHCDKFPFHLQRDVAPARPKLTSGIPNQRCDIKWLEDIFDSKSSCPSEENCEVSWWECDFCGKPFLDLDLATIHEKRARALFSRPKSLAMPNQVIQDESKLQN